MLKDPNASSKSAQATYIVHLPARKNRSNTNMGAISGGVNEVMGDELVTEMLIKNNVGVILCQFK